MNHDPFPITEQSYKDSRNKFQVNPPSQPKETKKYYAGFGNMHNQQRLTSTQNNKIEYSAQFQMLHFTKKTSASPERKVETPFQVQQNRTLTPERREIPIEVSEEVKEQVRRRNQQFREDNDKFLASLYRNRKLKDPNAVSLVVTFYLENMGT